MDLSKVAFTTKFPADKIVRTYHGSIPVANNADITQDIPHDLGRLILSETLYSIDNEIFYPAGMPIFPSFSNPGVQIILGAGVSASRIRLYITNYSGAVRTVYYKVMLIWPN